MAAVEQQNREETAAPAQSRGAVATIAPPRLPYHPEMQERFGVDRAAWRALVEAVFPAARTVEGVLLALSYCRARKLDPFKRPVHVVSIWDSHRRAYVESVWPGIGELRTTAFRTGNYAGCDAANYGPDKTETFSGRVKDGKDGWKDATVTVTYPEWCQFTVYRLIAGQRVAMPGPRVWWKETYARLGKTELPNEMWSTRPRGQLEKCAEAGALRRAFPEEIGNEISAEEAAGQSFDAVGSGGVVIDADPPPPRPERQPVKEQPAANRQEPAAERDDPEEPSQESEEPEVLDEAWQALARGWGETFSAASTKDQLDQACAEYSEWLDDPGHEKAPALFQRQVADFRREAMKRVEKASGRKR